MDRLKEKTALVTGATSGIGESIACTMAQEGAEVIIVGRNAEKGKTVERKISEQGGNGRFFPCDTTKEKDIIWLKKCIEEKYGKLDILVNNAGVFLTAPIEETDEGDWQKTFDTNVKGYFLMTKHFISLLSRDNGTILNNASVAGLPSFVDGRGAYMYSASKAAVIQFTKLCAKNYAKNVRINCICPGVVDTPIFMNRDFSRFDDKIPMGRVAKPEEIAKAALFLVSEDASYITGAVLPIDGGMSI